MLFLSFLLRIVRQNPAEPGINLLCNNHSPYTIPRLFVEIKWFLSIFSEKSFQKECQEVRERIKLSVKPYIFICQLYPIFNLSLIHI